MRLLTQDISLTLDRTLNVLVTIRPQSPALKETMRLVTQDISLTFK